MKTNLRTIVSVALLVAIAIIFSRFLSIQASYVKISFTFVPIAVCGMLFGPFWGAVAGALSDFIGANLFPSGAYFPGFTLTAALTGTVFGLFLHKSKRKWLGLLTASAINCFIITLLLNTLWLTILMNSPYLLLLPARAVQAGVMFAVQIAVLKPLQEPIKAYFRNRS